MAAKLEFSPFNYLITCTNGDSFYTMVIIYNPIFITTLFTVFPKMTWLQTQEALGGAPALLGTPVSARESMRARTRTLQHFLILAPPGAPGVSFPENVLPWNQPFLCFSEPRSFYWGVVWRCVSAMGCFDLGLSAVRQGNTEPCTCTCVSVTFSRKPPVPRFS